jgi:hypothetical protein
MPTASTGAARDGGRPDPGSTAGAASSTGSTSTGGVQPVAAAPAHVPRLPSLRVTAALAAAMLALGVIVGAAIGPAPSTSFAGGRVPLLLPSIAALAVAGAGGHAGTTSAQPPVTPQATPSATSVTAGDGAGDASTGTQSSEPATPGTSVSPTSTTNSPKTTPAPAGGNGGKQGKQTPLPPVTSVWLITLSGGTFAQALAQPSAAPHIDSQLVPAGTLLSGWSALAGSAFASEAGLLGGAAPQNLDSIVQPPCPEGAAGAQCAPETAGALSAADTFLEQTVPAIMSSAAYRAHGLIVITFGTIAGATASGLPAGASTATLSTLPPAGVLLISPFARPGTRPTTAYNPTSPKQSLSRLLR